MQHVLIMNCTAIVKVRALTVYLSLLLLQEEEELQQLEDWH
jgi:hypothetical protein